jgi:integrase
VGRRQRRTVGGIDRLPSGRYRVRVADPAYPGRRASTGTFRTRAEAEVALAGAIAAQERGAWIPPDRGRVTLSEYAPGWLDTRLTSRGEPLRPRVKELYELYLRHHILPGLGEVPLGTMTTAMVRGWHAGLLHEGPGASTVAKCYRLLRAILNTAAEDRHIAANPCTIQGAGVEPATDRTIPTVGEVYALADAVPQRYRALVLLAAVGGLRKGELFALTRAHVDLFHRTVTIAVQRQQSRADAHIFGPPKTEAGKRTLALPAQLIPELKAHLAQWAAPGPDGLLFVGEKGGPLRPGVWQAEWTKARKAVGLEHIHFHDLRHLAGTLAASTGASTKELMRRLGHTTPQAALRYQHATEERDHVVAEGIDRLIETPVVEPTARVLKFDEHRERRR